MEGYELRWVKGRPAPISSFGAGQGEHISVSEFKGEIGPPPILPFGGGQCDFSFESQSLAEWFCLH